MKRKILFLLCGLLALSTAKAQKSTTGMLGFTHLSTTPGVNCFGLGGQGIIGFNEKFAFDGN
jgi:hypothetical protein